MESLESSRVQTTQGVPPKILDFMYYNQNRTFFAHKLKPQFQGKVGVPGFVIKETSSLNATIPEENESFTFMDMHEKCPNCGHDLSKNI